MVAELDRIGAVKEKKTDPFWEKRSSLKPNHEVYEKRREKKSSRKQERKTNVDKKKIRIEKKRKSEE